MDMPGAYVCTVCQHVGQPKLVLKGSAWVAFFLLLLWLVPGIIYIIWAITNRRKCCEMCSSVNIVPANSVTGRRLLARAMKEDRE